MRDVADGTVPAFLCLRRGVSVTLLVGVQLVNFSLPTQRCFRIAAQEKESYELFSAYAEVFLRRLYRSVP